MLRRGTRLGLGALGLAGRAAGTLFARVPDPAAVRDPEPGPLALVPGAMLGLAIEVEKRAAAVIDVVAARSADAARTATRPAIVQRALRPVEDVLWRWSEVARREQTRNQAQAAALIPVIVQQVTENVIAQIDFVRVVEQIPVDDIAGAIDIEAIVARIDLGGVIRESTASLTTEAIDGVRVRGIDLDSALARLGGPRDVPGSAARSRRREFDVSRDEIRYARSRDAQGKRAGFASQAVAMVFDLLNVVVVYFALLLLYGGLRFVVTDSAFEMPQPGTGVNGFLLAVGWLVRAVGARGRPRAGPPAWGSSDSASSAPMAKR